jgi:hypothetical protein
MRKDRKAYLIARAYNKLFCQLLRLAVKDFRKGLLSRSKLETILKGFGLMVSTKYLRKRLPIDFYHR